MKKILFFLLLAFASCSKNSLQIGAVAEENSQNLINLKVGMGQNQVISVMGVPDKKESKQFDSVQYNIWYYITKPVFLGQTKYISSNYTPLVFQDCVLKGWGNQFYKHTFNIDNTRGKESEAKRQKYNDDQSKWPRDQHQIVPPMNEKNKDGTQAIPKNDMDKNLKNNDKTQDAQDEDKDVDDEDDEDDTEKKALDMLQKDVKDEKSKEASKPKNSEKCNVKKEGGNYHFWE